MTGNPHPSPGGQASDLRTRTSRLAAAVVVDGAQRGSPAQDPSAETLDVLVQRIPRLADLLASPARGWEPIDELTARLLVADLAMLARLVRAQTTEARRTLEQAAAQLASASADLNAARTDK